MKIPNMFAYEYNEHFYNCILEPTLAKYFSKEYVLNI